MMNKIIEKSMDSPETAKSILLGNIFACCYMQSILLYLYYFNRLYNIADSENLKLVYIVIVLELLRYVLFGIPKIRGGRNTDSHFRDITKIIAICLSMVGVYVVTAILFGAPIVSEWRKTFMFGLMLASVSVLPLCLNLGPDVTVSVLTSLNVSYSSSVVEQCLLTFKITLFGAWLGAVVIPLDWDRPWQVWPTPCCIGSFVGFSFAHVVSIINQVKLGYFKPQKTRKMI